MNLKEHGPGGSPLMYYGRARYKTIAQYHMLDFFGMNNQNVPFFDEYDRTKFSATPEEPWLYAIASGAQWNLLTSNPKFVEGVEINPARPGVV